MGLSLAIGSDGGDGITGGGDLRLLPPEHIFTVHCDRAHYVPVSGGGEASGVTGGQTMVGAAWIGIERDLERGLGGGMGGGGGGYGRDGDGYGLLIR